MVLAGGTSTGLMEVDFVIEFPDTTFDTNAGGFGTVRCIGEAIVAFDPDPLEIPEGQTRKVTATITKLLTANEAASRTINVRLVEKDETTFLGTSGATNIKFPGKRKAGSKITVTWRFPLKCLDDEIRGIENTGKPEAFIAIEFREDGPDSGDGTVRCVPDSKQSSSVNSGGAAPSVVAIDEETGYAFALNAFDGAIGVFDGATQIDTINLPCVAPVGASGVEPNGFNCRYQGLNLIRTAILLRVLAADSQAGAIVAIAYVFGPSTAGATEITTIPVGADPQGIDYDESTGQIYVANNGDGTVSVIDANTDIVTETTTVGGKPWTVKVDSVNGFAYVSNFTLDVVHVIDTATNTEVDTINVGNGPAGMEIDQEAGTLWVTNFIDSSVTVVGLHTAPLAASSLLPTTIDLGALTRPIDISLNEYTDRLYTANSLSDTSSVIDRTTRELVATIDVGNEPDAVAAHGKKGIVYVANHVENTLSIIEDPNPFREGLPADVNCDGVVDMQDTLLSLRTIGLGPTASGTDCPTVGQPVDVMPSIFGDQIWGDLNCDGVSDGLDTILMMRQAAGLAVPEGGVGCWGMSDPVYFY